MVTGGAKVIKGISKIKGLGVYENYTKPAGMQDFGIKNLIYGWNYSGKTTLSRLFAQLESKLLNPDLSSCSFAFETDGEPITETNFTKSTMLVRVFNSDFVRDNINFIGQNFKPILLLGKETDDAQKKLDHCEGLSKRVHDLIKIFDKEIGEHESEFAEAKKVAAANIKRILGLVETYTATHLGNDIKAISKITNSVLIADDKLRDNLKLALTPDTEKPSTVATLSVLPNIDLLYKEAVAVLVATPSLSNIIKHLEENPHIERWVEVGLPLHTEKDKCEFCGGDLSKHRLAELQAHFTKDLADHKSKVEQLLNRVKAARVMIQLPNEAEFNPQFRDKFRDAAVSLPGAVDAYNKAAGILAADVQKKIDTPFKAHKPSVLPDGLSQAVTDAVKVINQVIDDNNQIASNFTKAKQDAIKQVKFHYVQDFVDEQSKICREARVARLNAKQKRLNHFATVVQQEMERLRAIISQAQLGREEINKRLASMLGSEAVQIKVVSDAGQERFQLVRRNGKVARNLSDGERTAVAFAYFLTKLKELKPEQFEETIVYIDDPISSLDANHIFQVTAAIKEVFFGKNASGEWTTKCKQFFLSTHNFQFFHLIRELDPKRPPKAALYFIRKINATQSMLSNMPSSLSKYSSEYHFLFETIFKFHNSQDKGAYEHLMLLPNAVRRFTELYTYSRIPSDIDYTVDRRAETLFGPEAAKRILKVLHYFSHANNFDRIIGNSELIFDMEYAVNDMLSAIENNDTLHWKALVQSVS